jgi:hypothetical protein
MNATPAQAQTTLVQPLFTPHDHTVLLGALHTHARELTCALGSGANLAPEAILEAASALKTLDARTRQTARQLLTFQRTVANTILPRSYEAALASLDESLGSARTPSDLVQILLAVREAKEHETMPGFQVGVRVALELLCDGLETQGGGAFGVRQPTAVARACARGAVAGGLAGALGGIGPLVAAIVGGVSGSAVAALSCQGRD